MKKLALYTLILGLFSCGDKEQPLKTIDSLDLDKYLGTWYEITRLPNSFEKGLTCITANYSLKENGKIRVLNSGHKVDDKLKAKSSEGTAWIPDSTQSAQLKVSFFWPFAGDYFVIALDDDYQYALVGAPSRDYLWILSRAPGMPEDKIEEYLQIARDNGFDTEPMIRVMHDCK